MRQTPTLRPAIKTSATILLLGATACARREAQTPPPPARPTPAANALNPFGGLLRSVVRWLPADAQCPPPWLPPEAASRVDCAAMKRATGATAYIPRVIVGASLPAAVDLRASGLTGPIKAQEQVGACTAFAVSSVLDNAIRRSGGSEVASPLHIFATYSEAQDLGQVRGRNMTNEPTWPYNPPVACRFATGYLASDCGHYYGVAPGSWRQDPGLVAQRANADNAGHIPIVELEEITAPLDVVQLAGLLADGEAVWSSLAFERGAWDSLANGGGAYLPPQINAQEGHAVAVVGYRPGPYGREFILQNSWGTSWADRGYAYITERDLIDAWNYGYRIRTTGAPGTVGPTGGAPTSCAGGRAPWMGICLPDSLPGLPSLGGGSIGSCPAGSLPDPFTGGCLGLPR